MSPTGASTHLSYSLTMKPIRPLSVTLHKSVQFINRTSTVSCQPHTRPASCPPAFYRLTHFPQPPRYSQNPQRYPFKFFSSPKRPDRLSHPPLMDSGGGGSQRVKRLGQETTHSYSSRVYGKNDWIYTPTPIRLQLHLTPFLPHYRPNILPLDTSNQ